MLAYLRGIIQYKEMRDGPADRLVLEVAGVGFELSCSRRTLVALGQIGDEVVVHTQLTIRETDWTIYGFASPDESQMFSLLQSVSGVGPKSALALVGALGPQTLAEAIQSDDHKMVSQAPGVGPKLAQRIVLELKSKIEDWIAAHGGGAATADGAAYEEVKSILQGLGYTPTEISQAVKQTQDDGIEQDVEILVRNCLKLLGAASR